LKQLSLSPQLVLLGLLELLLVSNLVLLSAQVVMVKLLLPTEIILLLSL
jgi:hypothetical protein